MHAYTQIPPQYTNTHTHTHAHSHKPTERNFTENQHEINAFYVALKALIELWIHLPSLRKESLAFLPDYSDKKRNSRVSSDILVIFGTQCAKNTRPLPGGWDVIVITLEIWGGKKAYSCLLYVPIFKIRLWTESRLSILSIYGILSPLTKAGLQE